MKMPPKQYAAGPHDHLALENHPQDERQVSISLSAAGRALRADATAIPKQLLCASGKEAVALGRLRAELSSVRDDLFKSLHVDIDVAIAANPA